jgi:hypothetical protein
VKGLVSGIERKPWNGDFVESLRIWDRRIARFGGSGNSRQHAPEIENFRMSPQIPKAKPYETSPTTDCLAMIAQGMSAGDLSPLTVGMVTAW